MTQKFLSRSRKVFGSLCLSAGVLAIANVETIWQEYHRGALQESHELINAHNKGWLPKGKTELATRGTTIYKPLQSALSRSLEQDELHEQNPFSHLSSLEPLQEIMKKGVAKFQRETFRSPAYQEESGYDMISYEIEHPDGSRSSILAYLERADQAGPKRDIGAPDERIPFVVFMVASEKGSTYSYYRGDALVEQSGLTTTEAQAFVAQRLSSGVPFLSVSR